MDDLVQWLRAQLDEDERTARAATPGPWQAGVRSGLDAVDGDGWTVCNASDVDVAHIAQHDPARVLREIDAKRQVIAKYTTAVERMAESAALIERLKAKGQSTLMPEMERDTAIHQRDTLHGVLRLLALPCADRPGYREEWRP